MDWQFNLTMVLVALCAAYLCYLGWRAVRGGASKCGGCGCAKNPAAASPVIPAESLRIRGR